MTTIILGILFLIPILAALIILGIYRYVSYNRAKRLFDSYQTRSFKKNENTLKSDHKITIL